jgi:predicted RecA/RadA family phage recombinase
MATRKRASREPPLAIPLAKATEQRARLASAQADLAELTAAEKRGELLDAAEVERRWGGVLRTVRAGMLAVPSRIGAEADASHREGRVHELPKVAGTALNAGAKGYWDTVGKNVVAAAGTGKCPIGAVTESAGSSAAWSATMKAARRAPCLHLGTLNLIKWNAVFAG